ncbi:metal ABC transporter substrate-binding protein [Ornithinimicrobium sp. Y1694]|uniref:metal ABC transporter substrate-binding protein n=1 Tax=Ornithinimicrobium sp. Y1694 TaxID=3418590 RepID=UPI003CF61B4A
MSFLPRRAPLTGAALATALLLTACGGGGDDTGSGAGAGAETAAAGSETLEVITSIYPLEYLATRIAGEHADISTLTSPGADPHDVELTPRVVGHIGAADLVIYSAGLQSAVDQAVDTQAAGYALDVSGAADLLELGESESEHSGHDHDDEHAGHAGHDHGPEDPHFWLDTQRYGQVAVAIADQLGAIDPDNAQHYTANADDLIADLEELDEEFQAGLATCETRDLVATHEAFGYLAHRYDLHQLGITGISPDAEPSPARLAEVSAQVRALDVTTIYAEPNLPEDIARTVAQETGTQVAILDPLEGLTPDSAGADYLEVMRANLESLRTGLGCS